MLGPPFSFRFQSAGTASDSRQGDSCDSPKPGASTDCPCSSTFQTRPVTAKWKKAGAASPARCTVSRSSHFLPASEQSAMASNGKSRSMWTQTHPLDFSLVGHLSPTSRSHASPEKALRTGTVQRHAGMDAVHNVIEEFYSRLTDCNSANADHRSTGHPPPKGSGRHDKLPTQIAMATHLQVTC